MTVASFTENPLARFDVLDIWGPEIKIPDGVDEIIAAIAEWRANGRTPEIFYFGWGVVGCGVGHCAVLGSRLNGGCLDGQKFAVTGFDLERTRRFAERHGINFEP